MDIDSYPTEQELQKIKNWPLEADNYKDLMDYVESLWWMPEHGFLQIGQEYHLSTGGWSGNEDIIDAMRANILFWILCWEKAERGGHYVFGMKRLEDDLEEREV